MPEATLVWLAFVFGGCLVSEWYTAALLILAALCWGVWVYLEESGEQDGG